MTVNNIRIKSAIMHVLNNKCEVLVLSNALLAKGSDFYDYVKKHVSRLLTSDDVKICEFKRDSEIHSLLQNSNMDFIELSQEIAKQLFKIMKSNIEIPPANLIILQTECDDEDYIAILKLDYEPSYTHSINKAAEGEITDFIKQECIIPASNKKLKESALINTKDFSIRLVEKKYSINGIKSNYFSRMFLNCYTHLSNKVTIDIVQNAINEINRNSFYNDSEKVLEEKSAIAVELEENGRLDISKIPVLLFENHEEEQNLFQEKMCKYHLQDTVITLKEDSVKKKMTMHKIETDTGIVINIPMDQYRNTNNISFNTEADGTKTVTIKKIGKIKNK